MTNSATFDIQQFIERQPLGAFHWVVLSLCFSVLVVDGFDTAAIGYIAPALLVEWRMQKSALGPVLSAALFGLATGAVAAGPLADWVGRKIVLVVSVAFFGVASFATAFSASLEMLTALRFITGLGLGAAMPNAITLTAEYAPAARRSLLTNAIFCGFPLGAAGGGLIAAWLIPHYGWRSVFVLGGLLPMALAGILLWRLPESLRYLVANGKPADRVRQVLARLTSDVLPAGISFVVPESGHASGKRAVRLILSRSYLLGSSMLWLTYFMGLLIFYLLISWMPVLMKEVGFSIERAALASALFPLGGGIGAIVVGWLMDRMNPHAVIAAAYALTAGFVFCIGQGISNLTVLGASIFLAGIVMNGAQTAMPALAAQFYPTQGRATGVAWMLGIGRCGGIAGALLGAELMRLHIGFDMIFTLASIPAAVATIALVVKLAASGGKSSRSRTMMSL
ncbi:MAG: aromatic acid/H+ symport family MFS transporter [Herbaspirillum sp.]